MQRLAPAAAGAVDAQKRARQRRAGQLPREDEMQRRQGSRRDKRAAQSAAAALHEPERAGRPPQRMQVLEG
jgi:hypothetical protein